MLVILMNILPFLQLGLVQTAVPTVAPRSTYGYDQCYHARQGRSLVVNPTQTIIQNMESISIVKGEFETTPEFSQRRAEAITSVLRENPYYTIKLEIESYRVTFDADNNGFHFNQSDYGSLDRQTQRYEYPFFSKTSRSTFEMHSLLLDQPRRAGLIPATVEQARSVRNGQSKIFELIVLTPIEPYLSHGGSVQLRNGQFATQTFYQANIDCRFYLIE